MGFEQQSLNGNKDKDASGFKGEHFILKLDGQITKGLTFSYRQRFNKNTDTRFFNATDWLHLDWKINGMFVLSAGKQVVAIGGYEYDRAPIDLYQCSEFWNNIACYQLGAFLSYNFTNKDQFLLQVCNSPFRNWAGNDTYAWNLMWYGSHKFFDTTWSVNMMQYNKNSWINYISLGTRFKFSKDISLELDLQNKAASHQVFLFKDCDVMSELSFRHEDVMRYFLKYTYDVNKSGINADYTVFDGSELSMASAGVEGYFLKKQRDALRIFAVTSYSWGTNTNEPGIIKNKQFKFVVGFKLKLDMFAAFTKLVNK